MRRLDTTQEQHAAAQQGVTGLRRALAESRDALAASDAKLASVAEQLDAAQHDSKLMQQERDAAVRRLDTPRD